MTQIDLLTGHLALDLLNLERKRNGGEWAVGCLDKDVLTDKLGMSGIVLQKQGEGCVRWDDMLLLVAYNLPRILVQNSQPLLLILIRLTLIKLIEIIKLQLIIFNRVNDFKPHLTFLLVKKCQLLLNFGISLTQPKK